MREYVEYYNSARPHESIDRNSPTAREVEETGDVHVAPVLGRLHHRYRRAA